MNSQQYDRLFDEDEESLVKKPPRHTIIEDDLAETLQHISKKDKELRIAEVAQHLEDNSVEMPADLVKKIKAHTDRLKSFGYSKEMVKKLTAEKFHIEIYNRIDG